MRKFLLLAFLILPGMAFAQSSPAPVSVSSVFSSLPSLKQGVAFDIKGGNIEYLTTAEALNKWGFSLSGGYASSSGIVGTIDYDLGGLSRFGINTPLLSVIDLRIGFMVGLDDISTASSSGSAERNKLIYGPEVTVVSIKF